MQIRSVFFDAGETLVHPHPSFPELLTAALREHGHQVDPAVVRERLWVVSERFLKAAHENELWSTSAEKSRAFWSSIYETFLGELGVEWTEDLADHLYITFTDVSNFEEWLERLLEVVGVTRFFDVRVISGREGVEKPDPKIFLLALDRAGVGPEHSAYVGDNVHFDIEPAAEVGMLPVLLDRRGRYPDHDGIRITTMSQLPGVLGVG